MTTVPEHLSRLVEDRQRVYDTIRLHRDEDMGRISARLGMTTDRISHVVKAVGGWDGARAKALAPAIPPEVDPFLRELAGNLATAVERTRQARATATRYRNEVDAVARELGERMAATGLRCVDLGGGDVAVLRQVLYPKRVAELIGTLTDVTVVRGTTIDWPQLTAVVRSGAISWETINTRCGSGEHYAAVITATR